MKYENCYLSYANELYFRARSLLQQQTTLFAVHETETIEMKVIPQF
jgi:hypothetical protein